MSTDKRHQRMLDELLVVPGNEQCADCKATAPRWASVNLGIFLCVNCASVHRKMGTHRSRVKSVTLDSWTRDQITQIKSIGNKASNAIWNPNESLHPPPTSLGADERDSEIEKYIRRKYEQGAFRADRSGGRAIPAPTSLNRAREADGRLAAGSVSSIGGGEGSLGSNRRNPELNDIVAKKPVFGVKSPNGSKERDLPPLPVGVTGAPPRPRPGRSGSGTPAVSVPGSASTAGPSWQGSQMSSAGTNGNGTFGNLVDVNGATSSTLPLQLNSYNPFHQQQYQQQQPQHQQPFQQQQQYSQSTPMPSTSTFASPSPQPSFSTFPSSPQQFATSPSQFASSPQAQQYSYMGQGQGQFSTSPSPGGMLQPPSMGMGGYGGYGLSSSAPNTSMLASFDPLHPGAQQQQQQQQQSQYQQQQQQQYGGMSQGGYLSPGGQGQGGQGGFMGSSPTGQSMGGMGMSMGGGMSPGYQGYTNGGGQQWQGMGMGMMNGGMR